jgi:hypothetical protein
MKSSLRRRSSRTGRAFARASLTVLGATVFMLVLPGLDQGAHAAATCYDELGNPVTCPTAPPTTPPPTVAPPTVPPPTPATTPNTVSPQTVATSPPATTVHTTPRTTPRQVFVAPVTPAPTTTTTAKPKQAPVTTTSSTTTTTAAKKVASLAISRVEPPKSGGNSVNGIVTFAAIALVALLLVLGILGPELRGRLNNRRPSHI